MSNKLAEDTKAQKEPVKLVTEEAKKVPKEPVIPLAEAITLTEDDLLAGDEAAVREAAFGGCLQGRR